jgi:hypothetical protein
LFWLTTSRIPEALLKKIFIKARQKQNIVKFAEKMVNTQKTFLRILPPLYYAGNRPAVRSLAGSKTLSSHAPCQDDLSHSPTEPPHTQHPFSGKPWE